ncbi:MAG: NADH-quinone oxidoreductase subunit L [Acidobacteriota bacterium]
MTFLSLLWVVPLLPLAGFLVNGLLGRRFLPRKAVAAIACGTVLVSLVLSAGAVWELRHAGEITAAAGAASGLHVDAAIPRVHQFQWNWIALDSLRVPWSYALDPLSAVMLLVVTGVGFLIHVYSIGYMAGEDGFARFFAYLNLFMAMMLVLVLADSFLVMFVGWEGVGLCSYLLIGFHYRDMFDAGRRMSCADAGRKAFIVNRIGDYGFMLGMLLIFTTFATVSFDGVFSRVGSLAETPSGLGLLTAMALLLFVGAVGKSAQIPLYIWLPDAMAGPTPVSALIHAATMVTAGVYMVCRCAALFSASPVAMAVMAVIGTATALLAALIGCTQFDIKKVLAYSTVSQLGYMFLAAGVGAFSFAIFHVMTHAFFKALLFLGAGSVIHALGGRQDIRAMGALGRAIPWTFGTFLLAAAAIAGLPPAAGFFSKDAILAATFSEQPALWGVGVFTAGVTAFYIGRLVFLTFLSTDRVPAEARAHLHESPWSMRGPLVVLGILSVIGGWIGVPALLAGPFSGAGEILPRYLEPVFREARVQGGGMGALGHSAARAAGEAALAHPSPAVEWGLMAVSVLLALSGLAVAYAFYRAGSDLPGRVAVRLGGFYRLARDRFRVDELYDRLLLRPYRFLCAASDAVDRMVVDLAVNAVAIVTEIAGHVLKLFQTGVVRTYALSFFVGVLVLLTILVFG